MLQYALVNMKKRILICYDISDDKIRRKTVTLLEQCGIRWQYSVFFCNITKNNKEILLDKLRALIEPSDSIIAIPLNYNTLRYIEFIGKKGDIFTKEEITFL